MEFCFCSLLTPSPCSTPHPPVLLQLEEERVSLLESKEQISIAGDHLLFYKATDWQRKGYK